MHSALHRKLFSQVLAGAFGPPRKLDPCRHAARRKVARRSWAQTACGALRWHQGTPAAAISHWAKEIEPQHDRVLWAATIRDAPHRAVGIAFYAWHVSESTTQSLVDR